MAEATASTEVVEQQQTQQEQKTEPVEQQTEQSTEKKDQPSKTYTQEDLDRIVKSVRENTRYTVRREMKAFYKGRESTQPQEQRQEKKEEKEPARGDYGTYEEFIEARADFRARKATRDESAKVEREKGERSAHEARQKTFATFQKNMREKFQDIDERLEDLGDVPMWPAVQDAIAESPLGPEIFDDLVKNPKELERLSEMSQAAAVREIGRLEARFEATAKKADPQQQQQQTKQASKAPPPIAPPSGEPAASSDLPRDDEPIADWMRKERARGLKSMKKG